jgi:ribosomal protein S18 acetylase RimI-like enzyme
MFRMLKRIVYPVADLTEKALPQTPTGQTSLVPGLRILPAEPAEYPALWQMQRVAYATEALLYEEPIPPMTQSEADAIADCVNNQVLKATLDGRMVGSIRFQVRECICHITKLMVLPEYRHRGIGTALLLAAEAAAPGLRCRLFTGTLSTGNIRLYEQNGYRICLTDPDRQLVYLEKPAAPASPALPAES